jgi:SpoVK/Ycf46/Vps4 family AAA+-type ATPase
VSIIPSRFSFEISQHLFLSYADMPDYPLILAIFGRPGEGKTFQLRSILDQGAIKLFSLNAADLESDRAGQPGKLVVAEYVKAARSIEAGNPAALVIDDIDTTVGEWVHNTGTVNHQQILAQLMHLADHPNWVERIGAIRRVPVFVTGNDPSKIYSPLKRPGRMIIFQWLPTYEERKSAVEGMFGSSLSPNEVDHLVALYEHRGIAFFSQLKLSVYRVMASSIIAKSANNLASIVRDPDKYRRLVDAAIASSTEGFFDLTCKQALILDESVRSADENYLDIANAFSTP